MTPNEVEIEDVQQPTQQPTAPSAAPQPAQQTTGCPGDCNRCTPMHRSYCASQIAFNMQNAVARIENTLATLAQIIGGIETRVAHIEERLAAQAQDEAQQPNFCAPEPEKPKRTKKPKNDTAEIG